MSFPNIPDIKPDIDVTREDAVNLLLISIALEEISLSDLIEAETQKIRCIVGGGDCNTHSTQDIKDINSSVNKTLKDIIKLQMLLQFKLEDVLEIVCPTTTTTSTTTTTTTTTTTSSTTTTTTASKTTTSTTTTTTTTSSTTTTTTASKTTTSTTTTTTTTRTTTSTTSTASTTTRKKCVCSLTGRGVGSVLFPVDLFFGGTAVVQACVCADCGDIENSMLCYSVQRGNALEILNAFPKSLVIECPTPHNPNRIVISGIGPVVKKERSQPDITGIGRFVLTVRDGGLGADYFQMEITVDNMPELNHNSGIVLIRDSNLVIGICPDC